MSDEKVNSAKCTVCEICQEEFTSKTKLFKHLVIHGFEGSVKPIKIVFLVGWLSEIKVDSEQWVSEITASNDLTSQKVENLIFSAIYAVDNNLDSIESIPHGTVIDHPKRFSRGSSCLQRSSLLLGEVAPSLMCNYLTLLMLISSIRS